MPNEIDQREILFTPGDWIVHSNLGIGQVTAVETKSISDEENTYYRIETEQMLLWVPVSEADAVRMVAPPETFAEAEAVLQRPSRRMSKAFQSRLARIRKAQAAGTPLALARTVRDLWARQKRRGKLSSTERQALRKMTEQLLSEWSVSMNMDENQTSKKLYALLRQQVTPAR